MVSRIQYYTGIIFQAYTYGTGEPLVKGGRYNELLKHFGAPAASVGFVIMADSLLTALSRQKIEILPDEEPYVLTYTEGNSGGNSGKGAASEKRRAFCVSEQKRRRAYNMRYLTIALTKGRLAQKTLDTF
mgnify:CR=1 FL=1